MKRWFHEMIIPDKTGASLFTWHPRFHGSTGAQSEDRFSAIRSSWQVTWKLDGLSSLIWSGKSQVWIQCTEKHQSEQTWHPTHRFDEGDKSKDRFSAIRCSWQVMDGAQKVYQFWSGNFARCGSSVLLVGGGGMILHSGLKSRSGILVRRPQ